MYPDTSTYENIYKKIENKKPSRFFLVPVIIGTIVYSCTPAGGFLSDRAERIKKVWEIFLALRLLRINSGAGLS
jgi:hypothetical protein